VRELVQNWLDERDAGAPSEMTHRGGTLSLWNEGAELKRRHMALFGSTTKTGVERGRFGEGFKVGVLALLREGLGVRVCTSHGTYRASIEQSNAYAARVLVLHREDHIEEDGVRVLVDGLDDITWNDFKARFLWDSPRNAPLRDHPGEIYAKDIWVMNCDSRYGYNFENIETDRDRRIIDHFNLTWEMGKIINNALKERNMSPSEILGMLESDAPDVTFLNRHVTSTTKSMIVSAFTERYGPNAVPAITAEKMKEEEHAGLKPVLTTENTLEILKDYVAGVMRKKSASSCVPEADLSECEKKALWWIRSLLSGAGIVNNADIKIVSFLDKNRLGRRTEDAIPIAREILADKTKLLQAMVEEIAHAEGPDGSMEHKWEMHRIYAALIMAKEGRQQ